MMMWNACGVEFTRVKTLNDRGEEAFMSPLASLCERPDSCELIEVLIKQLSCDIGSCRSLMLEAAVKNGSVAMVKV